MWQAFATLALVATALQNVADKWAIVSDRKIDPAVATFWRNALALVFVVIVGLSGILGPLTWYFDPFIIAFALLLVGSAFFYTYMLKHVEVTGIEMDNYLAPLVFLVVDVMFVEATLNAGQIAGVILLALGGFLLAVDARTRHLKREFSPQVIGIIVFWVFYGGVQYYLFKYLNTEIGLSSVSFMASAYVIAVSVMLLIVTLRGKFRALFQSASTRYLPPVALSKAFDTAATLLTLTALTYASVSQVSAIGALAPLFLLVIAVFVQKETRFNIRERVDKANILGKSIAVLLLALGIYLVS